jgi:hypothetical protein
VAISVAKARQICTQAELDLVLQSTTRQIGDLDAKQLKAAVRRARTMRDKWRDLASAQTRGTKAEDPANLDRANARSSEKATLFDEALQRFEKRLAKVDGADSGKGAAKKNPPKKVRAGGHRAEGAEVRDALNEKTEMLNSAAPTKPSGTGKAAGKSKSAAGKSAAGKSADQGSDNGAAAAKDTKADSEPVESDKELPDWVDQTIDYVPSQSPGKPSESDTAVSRSDAASWRRLPSTPASDVPTCSIPIAVWLRPTVWRQRQRRETSW